MKSKEYLIRLGDALYEATVTVERNNTRASLSCSPIDNKWTDKALKQPTLSAHDDGNGIHVSTDKGETFHLDYSQVGELRALLNVMAEEDHIPTTFKKWRSKW